MTSEEDDRTTYVVVVNHEEQYSIWPEQRELPRGWSSAGKHGTKSECLEHIRSVWTDMRPLSLRRAMEHDAMQDSTSRVEGAANTEM
jgi:MbtH protein